MKQQLATRKPKLSLSLAGIGFFLAVVVMPLTATGAIITVEPDDYLEGTDLSYVSPYVTLQGRNGGYGSWSVTATRSNSDYRAPTGELVFGQFPGGWTDCADHWDCVVGFSMMFHQPVNWVSLMAINVGYGVEGDFGLPTAWMAFDADKKVIATGVEDGGSNDNLGRPYSLNINTPDMKYLVVGGYDTIGSHQFDRLVFSTVPEPGSLALISLGLGVLLATRRLRNPMGRGKTNGSLKTG